MAHFTDLIDLAATANVVEKSGSWYTYKNARLGQGRENAKQFLFENKDLADEIRQAVLEQKGLIGGKTNATEPSAATEPAVAEV